MPWSSCRCRWRRSARRSASRAWTCGTARNVRDKSRMKAVLRARGHAVRPPPAGHRHRGGVRLRRRRSASRSWRNRRPAPARRRPTGSTTPTRFAAGCAAVPPQPGRRRAARGVPGRARSTRSTASPSAARRCGRPSRTTSRRRWRCCATRGSSGRCCCRATIDGPRVRRRSSDVGPAALQALGVRDALTHMEWFRRPDGSVAVSEVGARPPGAQLASMIGYVHDVDFYRTWAELVILDRSTPPERRYAAGYGLPARTGPAAGSAPFTGSRQLQRADSGTWSSRPACPRPGSRPSSELRGRGLRHRAATPTPPWCGTPCDADRRARVRVELRGGRSVRTDRDALARLSRPRWRYFTRGAGAAVGATVIGVGDQPPHVAADAARDALAHYEHVSLGRRGRRARRAARAGPARPDRPGGVPVGALHGPGRAHPRGVRAAGHDRRADACRSATRN